MKYARRTRSGSEVRFPTFETSDGFLSPANAILPKSSLSVVIPTHCPPPQKSSATTPKQKSSPHRSRSRSPSLSSVVLSTSPLATSFGSPHHSTHSTLRGFVLGHRPIPIHGSSTLPSPRSSSNGLPPKSRPTILPNKMGTIKEANFLTSEQVSRV
ncbi:unnamed protein product [Caenorhabditis angaria]|uniref:Uncharacterized protein n=1 Tax=Caenorhabditis angaria TaxID=860376 RepID=A0A9P1IQL3_9PELO|nr:unnamed protein product [Caenorhabditis angaria]